MTDLDLPLKLSDLRFFTYPVQVTEWVANLYLTATVRAQVQDIGDWPWASREWTTAHTIAGFVDVLQPGDKVVAVCPSFLVGGIARQETGALSFASDNWGLAINQIDSATQGVPTDDPVFVWNRPEDTVNDVVLRFEVLNLGQAQLPDVCLKLDALIYRKGVRVSDGFDARAARFGRIGSASLRFPVARAARFTNQA